VTVSEIPGFIDPEVWNAAIRPLDPQGDWGERSETEYLLNLYRATGGRWVVIHDRWCQRFGSASRTVEQLKSRFVKVLAKMIDLKLCTSGSVNFRYNELYDQQRRNFNERLWKRDPLLSDQTIRIIKDLFKKKKAPMLPSLPSSGVFTSAGGGGSSGVRVGVTLASQLCKSPEIPPDIQERIRVVCHALLIPSFSSNQPNFIRSLRTQRVLASIQKLVHCLLIIKDVVLSKRSLLPGQSLSLMHNPPASVSVYNPPQIQPVNSAMSAAATAPGAGAGIRVRVQPGGVSQAVTQSRPQKKRKTDASLPDSTSNNQ
jgi:hypothetical protein